MLDLKTADITQSRLSQEVVEVGRQEGLQAGLQAGLLGSRAPGVSSRHLARLTRAHGAAVPLTPVLRGVVCLLRPAVLLTLAIHGLTLRTVVRLTAVHGLVLGTMVRLTCIPTPG